MKRGAEVLESSQQKLIEAHTPRSSKLTLESLAPHFHLPLNDAADELGLSLTALKRICRHLGLSRWPHRQLHSLDTDVAELRAKIERHAAKQGPGITPSESDSARLQVLLKKRNLIVRGAVEGVEVSVRSAIYHADVCDVDEEALFDTGTCSKLAHALRGVKRRKGLQGKSLAGFVDAVRSGKPLPPGLKVPGYRDPGDSSSTTSSKPAKPKVGRRARPAQEMGAVRSAETPQLPTSAQHAAQLLPQQPLRAKAVPRPGRKLRQLALPSVTPPGTTLHDAEVATASKALQRGRRLGKREQQLGTAQDHRASSNREKGGGGGDSSDTDDDWLPSSANTSAANGAAVRRKVPTDIKGAAPGGTFMAAAAAEGPATGVEDPGEAHAERVYQRLLRRQFGREGEPDVARTFDGNMIPQLQVPMQVSLEQAAVPYDLLPDGPLAASLCRSPDNGSVVSNADTAETTWASASSDDGGSAFGAEVWEDVARSTVVESELPLAEEELLFAEYLGEDDVYSSGAGLEPWLLS